MRRPDSTLPSKYHGHSEYMTPFCSLYFYMNFSACVSSLLDPNVSPSLVGPGLPATSCTSDPFPPEDLPWDLSTESLFEPNETPWDSRGSYISFAVISSFGYYTEVKIQTH